MTHKTYDAAGNVTEVMRLEENHDEMDDDDDIGLNVTADDDYVQTATYFWYDAVGRVTTTAAYGTCNADDEWEYTALTARPANPPTYATQDVIDGKILLTTYFYNAAGRLETVTDPRNIATKTTYDGLGRTVMVEENQDGGNNERTTLTGYDGLSNVTQLIADTSNDEIVDDDLSGGAWTTDVNDQVTTYIYYDSTRSPYHADLVTEIRYPDRADADDDVEIAYWLDGRPNTRTLQKLSGEQNRTVITYNYDDLRRPTKQRVTTPGGVDETVLATWKTYDDLGRVETATSYASANETSPGTPVNQVQYVYNDLGMLDKEYQEHEGAVDGNTLYVQYNNDTTSASGVFTKAMRPTSVRYPCVGDNHYTRTAGAVAARLVHSLYVDPEDFSGLGDALSRLTALSNESTRADEDEVYAAYSYNGAGRIVVEDYVQPQVRLDYWGQTADTYAGFDRFGRVKKQLWRYYGGTPADRDRFEYKYDRNSNRTSKDLTIAAATGKDEKYTYDNLDRLTAYDRGTLSGSDITSKVRNEAWGLSPTGNWNTYQVDADGNGEYDDTGDLDQVRQHNRVNEIADTDDPPDGDAIETTFGDDWANPVYDARGNMTKVPKPSDLTAVYACKYDAWNRLTFVWVDTDADGTADEEETVIARYEYDGLGRRTKKHLNADTDDDFDTFQHFFYNSGWQLLETRTTTSENDPPDGAKPVVQYVWSVRYIDSLVLRDENKDSDDDCTESGTDERLYYLNDANMNVTCLVNTFGTVVERYVYDPYGAVKVYSDDWSTVVTTWAASKKNNIRYCGYFFDDETGLYHVRHRYYHPTLGRFVQRDPVGHADGPSLYQYVEANPSRYVDSGGLAAVDPSEAAREAALMKRAQEKLNAHKAKRGEYITQVQSTIKANLCTKASGCLKAGCTEPQCENDGTRIATAFVDAFLANAYSPTSFGAYLWKAQSGTRYQSPDPWDNKQNMHAGWQCYQWMMISWEAVKKQIRPGSCLGVFGAGYFDQGTGKLEHSWLLVVGCQANPDGSPGASFQKQLGNDRCTVRLDSWAETEPKAYTPDEHRNTVGVYGTYTFQYVQTPTRGGVNSWERLTVEGKDTNYKARPVFLAGKTEKGSMQITKPQGDIQFDPYVNLRR